MLDRIAREILRSERVPIPILWLLASDGMAAWYRWLARGLESHLGGKENTRRILSRCMAQAFERRFAALRNVQPELPDDARALPLVMHGLYRAPSARKTAWVLGAIGGPPKNVQEKLRAFRLVSPLDYKTRWIEVATH